MPKSHKPNKHDLLPKIPCSGCDTCGDCNESALYALVGEKYKCFVCFYTSNSWPKPWEKEDV